MTQTYGSEETKIILLIDSRPRTLSFLKTIFEAHHNVTIATSKEEAYEILHGDRELPDLIILDVNMPGINGLRFANHVRQQWKIPVVFLSCDDDPTTKPDAITAYAADLVTKPFDFQELVTRVERILSRPETEPTALSMTVRQIQVIKLMADGFPDPEIAKRLNISEHTVKWHIREARKHLEAKSRAHLVSIALRQGLISGKATESE
jgi:DNA-binding NarL/FixJ family response regulator